MSVLDPTLLKRAGALVSIVGLTTAAAHLFIASRPITTCGVVGAAEALCGWRNPEDMTALPDGRHVIVSEFGHQNGSRPGSLALLDVETASRRVLYPAAGSGRLSSWGAPDCLEKSPTSFGPHGIHLSQRSDGRVQLLVVQHGGRESIEMFEVVDADGAWALVWRGCVVAPEGSMLNDVVSTPEGDFLATHMMRRGNSPLTMFGRFLMGSLFGTDTGLVIEWNSTDGFSEMLGTAGVVPNGIQISPDGESVFVNYSGGEVRRVGRRTGEIEARNDELPPLDNSSWTPAGRLLLAAGSGRVIDMVVPALACGNLAVGICPAGHAILEVDPSTLEARTVYRGGRGTPGGTGTIGPILEDGSMLVGTFAGDRIVRVTREEP